MHRVVQARKGKASESAPTGRELLVIKRAVNRSNRICFRDLDRSNCRSLFMDLLHRWSSEPGLTHAYTPKMDGDPIAVLQRREDL